MCNSNSLSQINEHTSTQGDDSPPKEKPSIGSLPMKEINLGSDELLIDESFDLPGLNLQD